MWKCLSRKAPNRAIIKASTMAATIRNTHKVVMSSSSSSSSIARGQRGREGRREEERGRRKVRGAGRADPLWSDCPHILRAQTLDSSAPLHPSQQPHLPPRLGVTSSWVHEINTHTPVSLGLRDDSSAGKAKTPTWVDPSFPRQTPPPPRSQGAEPPRAAMSWQD